MGIDETKNEEEDGAVDIIIPIITPGFHGQKIQQVITMSRIILIGQLPFLVAGNILTGVGQANTIFLITALATVIYNIGIIIGIILLAGNFQLFGPVVGTIIGAIAFFVIQLPIIYLVKLKFQFKIFDKKVLREFITLFIPRVLSVLATQIDLTIDLTLSTMLGPGNYTIFFFAQHLQLFPVSFVGMAFGQASLPYLSNLFKTNQIDQVKKIYIDSILQLLYLSVPLSFFFIFARTPLVRIIYGGPKFDWAGTNLTAITVSAFALSIPAHTIFYFLTRSFYAASDTKTPFIINFFTVIINTVLSIYFIFVLKLPVYSLAMSFSIAIMINVLLLMFFFYKKIGGFLIEKLVKNSVKIYIIAFIATFIPYITLKVLDPLVINTTRTINLIVLSFLIFSLYGIIYLFLSWVFTVEEIYLLTKIMTKIKEAKRRLTEVNVQID